MNAQEAVLTEREVQDFAVAVTAFAAGRMDGAQTVSTVVAIAERIVGQRLAALDTPAETRIAAAGTYPCCAQCDPGCSGRHEWPCPRCQTAAMLAEANKGAARAKGELA